MAENNAKSNVSEFTPDQLLMYAAMMTNDASPVDRLEYAYEALNSGADPNLMTVEGYTPLMYAANNGEQYLVEVLLRTGAEPNTVAEDDKGSTYFPLMFAVDRGHEGVVRQLLENGANSSQALGSGITALHHAIERNYPGIVQDLLDFGADLDALAGDLNPLMYLATLEDDKDRSEIMRLIQDAMRHNANLVPTSKAVNVLNENAARAAAIPTHRYKAGRPKGKMEGGQRRRQTKKKLKSRRRRSRRRSRR